MGSVSSAVPTCSWEAHQKLPDPATCVSPQTTSRGHAANAKTLTMTGSKSGRVVESRAVIATNENQRASPTFLKRTSTTKDGARTKSDAVPNRNVNLTEKVDTTTALLRTTETTRRDQADAPREYRSASASDLVTWDKTKVVS